MENNLIEMLKEAKGYLESLYPNVHEGVQRDLASLICKIDSIQILQEEPSLIVGMSERGSQAEVGYVTTIKKLEDRVKFLEGELHACVNKATKFGLQKDIYVNKYRFLVRDLNKILKDNTNES